MIAHWCFRLPPTFERYHLNQTQPKLIVVAEIKIQIVEIESVQR
jgi:hypothetical protein